MPSSQTHIPVFGSMNPTLEYKTRPAAYALITDQEGRIAAVKGKGRHFLPGGGSLPGETPEQTVKREVKEEFARDVQIVRRIGEAIQYFFAEGQHYRMEAVFFEARFAGEATDAGEHELYWLDSDEIAVAFYHQCHTWAAGLL